MGTAVPLVRTRVSVVSFVLLFLASLAAAQGTQEATQGEPSASLADASALIEKGRYADAEAMARRLLSEAEAAAGAESAEAAAVLDVLVGSLLRGGKASQPETKEFAERAVKVKENLLGAEHPDLAKSLTNLAGVREDTGDYVGARPLYERALAISEKALGPQHPDVARSLGNLAFLLRVTVDYAGARSLYERALAINELALGPDHAIVANNLNDLGVLLAETGDYAGARSLFERALAVQEKALGPEHHAVGVSLGNLAVLLLYTGDYAGARPLMERALAVLEKALGPEHPEVAISLNNLAALLVKTGDYAGARPLTERALAVLEKALGPEHPEVAISLNNLAALLEMAGDYAGARPLTERALAVLEKALGPEHPEVAHSLNTLAALLCTTGDYAGARPLMERAVAVREKALGPEHPEVAHSLNTLACLLLDTSDYAGARPLIERALAIQEKALGPDHPDVAVSLVNLTTLLSKTGDYAGARLRFERALPILKKAFGPDHPGVGQAMACSGEVLFEAGVTGESMESALQGETIAREHFRLTARTLSERQALMYAARRGSGLSLALSIAAGGFKETPEAKKEAFDALIRGRALVLDEMAGRRRSLGARALNPETARLVENLETAGRRLANLTVRGPQDQKPEIYRKLLDDARKERVRAEQALAAKSAEFREEQAKYQLGFTDVLSALPSRSALVAFARFDLHRQAQPGKTPPPAKQEPVPSYMAFVLNREGGRLTVVPLGSAEEVEALVLAWRKEAAEGALSPWRSPEESEEAYREAGGKLRQALWDPLAPYVAGSRMVFVVPDGALNLVNLAALPVDDGKYLVETAVIHYISAERDLAVSRAGATTGRGVLAVGGPAFDETSLFASLDPEKKEKPVQVAASRHFRGERSACGDFQSLEFKPLPDAVREAEEVASLWKKAKKTDAVLLTAAEASEARFKETAPGRSVLHLATHGFFLGSHCPSALERPREERAFSGADWTEPPPVTGENPLLLSGLALAGANHRTSAGQEEEDGILTAEEIAAMNLTGTEWAVLSACDSGVGEIKAGEGVFGLRRAFQVAGAGTVIMSLWPVEDESARGWIHGLYSARFNEGKSTVDAVRQASLAILTARRREGQSTHPYFWAGFVAAGDWK